MRNHILDKPRLYQWTLHVARSLPRPLLYSMARLVGGLVYACSPGDRPDAIQVSEEIAATIAFVGFLFWRQRPRSQ